MDQNKINDMAKALKKARYHKDGSKVDEIIEALAVAFGDFENDPLGEYILSRAAKKIEEQKNET